MTARMTSAWRPARSAGMPVCVAGLESIQRQSLRTLESPAVTLPAFAGKDGNDYQGTKAHNPAGVAST